MECHDALFSRLLVRGSDHLDDEFVARTIDEVVADMLPSSALSGDAYTPSNTRAHPEHCTLADEAQLELSAEATASAKRLRHREAMQRCRERRRSRMGALAKQQRELKMRLHELLTALRQRDEPVAVNQRAVSEATRDELHAMFIDIVRLKEQLVDEREAMQQSLSEHQKFEKIVTSASKQIVNEPTMVGGPQTSQRDEGQSDSLEDDASSSGQDSSSEPANRKHKGRPAGHWVQYLDQDEPLFYEPEPEESIADHTRECFLRVRRLQDSFLKNTTGLDIQDTYCLGWHAQHTLARCSDGRLELRFRFSKRVPLRRKSLADIQLATWNVMKDPAQNARLYSSLVVCKIVQFIGENAFIFIRNAPDKDKRLHIRYFSLHSQMEYLNDRDERATVTLMKILDKDPHFVETPGKSTAPVVWLKEGTLFLGFTEKLASEEIEIEYGGSIHCMSDQHAAYLLIEVGGALMRWEQMVLPQRLLV